MRRPLVPAPDVQVRPADARRLNLDKDLVLGDLRHCDLFEGEAGAASVFRTAFIVSLTTAPFPLGIRSLEWFDVLEA